MRHNAYVAAFVDGLGDDAHPEQRGLDDAQPPCLYVDLKFLEFLVADRWLAESAESMSPVCAGHAAASISNASVPSSARDISLVPRPNPPSVTRACLRATPIVKYLLRVAVPLFWGRFGLPIPREVHFRIVFGAPLRFASETETDSDSRVSVDKDGLKEVSDEQLIEAHGAYVDALKQLFDENKTRFGYADRELCVM